MAVPFSRQASNIHTPLRGDLLYKASPKLRVMLQDEAGFGRINNTERIFVTPH